MKMSSKSILKSIKFCGLFLIISSASAQNVQKEFYRDSLSNEKLASLYSVFGKNKSFDTVYEKQILTALSYFPELKDVKIKFRLLATNTPLSSRPTFFSLFKNSKKRNYVVTISTNTNRYLEPILFKNLNYNAQIGVLGHELSHVSDYTKKDFIQMTNIICIEIFSKKLVDKFERSTDELCINHGLGYQILDWSKSVRENLKINYWRGANNIDSKSKRERYLNPNTIQNKIDANLLYKYIHSRSNDD